MKDSQPGLVVEMERDKYIKADNERFSTANPRPVHRLKYIKADNERFSTVEQPGVPFQ